MIRLALALLLAASLGTLALREVMRRREQMEAVRVNEATIVDMTVALRVARGEVVQLEAEVAGLREGPLPPTERETLQGKIAFLEEGWESMNAELAVLREQVVWVAIAAVEERLAQVGCEFDEFMQDGPEEGIEGRLWELFRQAAESKGR